MELHFGARLLWKNKGFSATVVATLAVCIAANTAAFSVLHSVVLEPLPFPESERILLMYNSYPNAGVARAVTGVPDYYDRLRDLTVCEEQALYNNPQLSVGEAGSVQQVPGMGVTPSFFRLLRVQPLLGRLFSEEDGEVGKERKVVLSHAFWQESFGGDTSVLGRDLRVYGNPYTIVGVLPQDFRFLDPEVRLFRPLAFTPEQKSDERRHNNSWEMIGRLKPGATLEQAQAQIDAINAGNMERFPHFREVLTNAGFHTKVVPFQEEVVRSISQTLYLLWGGALFVLMIGVINIANLALARGSVRIKELATRYALGAGRWRVTRQLLAESALLTAAGAGLGLLLGYWSLRLLRYLHIERIPRGSEISLDGSVLSFVLGLSLGAGLVIGAIPVIQGLRANLNLVFREESRSSTGGRRSRLLRGGLVVTQVAFALVLLMGAGLLIASFRQVVAVRPGFVPEQVLTGSVALPSVRYREAARQRSFMQRSLERIRALPGVIHAGATNTIPFGDDYSDSVILAEGYVMQPGESMISGDNMSVTPQYFEAMRIPLLEGRYFDESDSPDSPRVIIIDQRLARKFWPDSSPVGKRMWRPTSPEELQNPEKAEWFTVVGVVGSVKLRALVDAEERIGSYYFPLAQQPDSGLTFAVRTTADTGATMAAMRRVIAEIDPELPFYDTRTMEERIDNSLVSRRSPMLLSVCFGAVALFLAAVGIYGVLSYLVAQRTKEIGIRIALGSDSGGVFQLVFKEGLLITGIGFALGILGSWLLTRYIESVLFGVRPLDPPVLVVVCLVLGMVALSASTLPARRAARVDPITALRQE